MEMNYNRRSATMQIDVGCRYAEYDVYFVITSKGYSVFR